MRGAKYGAGLCRGQSNAWESRSSLTVDWVPLGRSLHLCALSLILRAKGVTSKVPASSNSNKMKLRGGKEREIEKVV